MLKLHELFRHELLVSDVICLRVPWTDSSQNMLWFPCHRANGDTKSQLRDVFCEVFDSWVLKREPSLQGTNQVCGERSASLGKIEKKDLSQSISFIGIKLFSCSDSPETAHTFHPSGTAPPPRSLHSFLELWRWWITISPSLGQVRLWSAGFTFWMLHAHLGEMRVQGLVS